MSTQTSSVDRSRLWTTHPGPLELVVRAVLTEAAIVAGLFVLAILFAPDEERALFNVVALFTHVPGLIAGFATFAASGSEGLAFAAGALAQIGLWTFVWHSATARRRPARRRRARRRRRAAAARGTSAAGPAAPKPSPRSTRRAPSGSPGPARAPGSSTRT